MKKINITLLFLFLCFAWQDSYAQYFSKLYIQGRPSMLFGSIKAINDKFYVTGVTTTVRNPNYEKAVLGKINNDGTVAFIESIVDSDARSYDIFSNTLKKSADGNLIATGDKRDSVQKAFLMKADTNGNILLWREYTESGNLIFQGDDIVEVPDSGYLLAINICRSNYISHVKIIRTDVFGEVLNANDYFNGVRAWPSIIKPMLNGHFMVGAFTGDPSSNTPYWAKTWLIEVDRMGNMVRDWVDTSKKNLWPNGMEQTADSGWIIVRQHLDYDISNIQAFNGSILKLDKNFTKQWEIDTGGIDYYTGMFDVKILSDGSYICVGSDQTAAVIQGSVHDYGWLMKVSVSGEILWQSRYLADSSSMGNSYLNSVDIMPDGGFVACGKIQGSIEGQQGWIIRTDSNGCLLDNCGRVTEVEQMISRQEVEMKVYPNPASSSVVFQCNTSGIETNITIYDIYGRSIGHADIKDGVQISLDTRQWQDGFYIWRAVQQNNDVGQGKIEIMR